MWKTAISIGAILLATTIRWLNGIFVRYLDLPIATQTFLRLSTPCILCGIYLLYHKKPLIPKDWRTMTSISAANAARIGLLMAWYATTTATIVTSIQRVNVIIVVILAYFLLGERITKIKAISVIVWFTGVIIIWLNRGLAIHHADIIGIWFVLLSAMFSGYIHTKYKSMISANGIAYMLFYQSVVGTIVYGIYSLLYSPLPTMLQLGVGVFHSALIWILGFGLYFRGMKHIQASYSVILIYFEIVSAAFFSFLFFREIPSIPVVIGICLIISSWLLVTYWLQNKAKA